MPIKQQGYFLEKLRYQDLFFIQLRCYQSQQERDKV